MDLTEDLLAAFGDRRARDVRITTLGRLDHQPRRDPIGRATDLLHVDPERRRRAEAAFERARAELEIDRDRQRRAEAAFRLEVDRFASERVRLCDEPARIDRQDEHAGEYVVKRIDVEFDTTSPLRPPVDIQTLLEAHGLVLWDWSANGQVLSLYCHPDIIPGELAA